MTANPELWDALLPVVDIFEALEIRYCIGGSVASSFAGVTRATLDVDVVADLRMEHVARLVEALAETYYVDAEMIVDAIQRGKQGEDLDESCHDSRLEPPVCVLA